MAEAAISLNPQQIEEMSLIDLTYIILRQTNKPFHYRDLMAVAARLKGLTEEQINEVIARLYTEINIDGRFVCIGNNVWGLKRWYPTDKAQAEKAAGGKKFVRKDMDEDDDDFYDDEDDDVYVEDEHDEEEPFGDYAEAEDDENAEEFEEEALEEEEAGEAEVEEEEELDSFDEEEEDF